MAIQYYEGSSILWVGRPILVIVTHEAPQGQALVVEWYLYLEFPTKSGHGVKHYSARSYSAGDTYPNEECRRLVL
jgi:hypothetical protein